MWSLVLGEPVDFSYRLEDLPERFGRCAPSTRGMAER